MNEINKPQNEDGDKEQQETKENIASPAQVEKELTNKKVREPIVKWNGDINFGNILTILVIVISAWGLYYNKKGVETKVEDLQAVVKNLEEEKLTRELQGLEGATNRLNSFSYNLGYTVDQFQDISNITNYEFLFMLKALNALIDLSLKRNDLTAVDRMRLELFKERNSNKQRVFLLSNLYSQSIADFEKKNKPQEEGFRNIDEFHSALSKYNDTFKKHIDLLLHIEDSLSREPIKKIRKLEGRYVEFKKKSPKHLNKDSRQSSRWPCHL